MTHYKDYVAPETEALELSVLEQVLATSADIDDYDNEDFIWS